MEIRTGAEVVGRDGKLGEVARFVVEPRAERVENLVVKAGGLIAHERIVPLGRVVGMHDDAVELDLDHDGLEGMIEYDASAFRGPDTHWTAPPAIDSLGVSPV